MVCIISLDFEVGRLASADDVVMTLPSSVLIWPTAVAACRGFLKVTDLLGPCAFDDLLSSLE